MEILRKFNWNEETKSGGWTIPTSEEIENGIVAETKDEYDKLKVAAPLLSAHLASATKAASRKSNPREPDQQHRPGFSLGALGS